jgi:hypothetical protein
MFHLRALFGDGRKFGIHWEKHAMRVAHANSHWRTDQRQVQQVHIARQRNFAPIQQRRAHIHPDLRPAQFRQQHPARRANAQTVQPPRRHHAGGHAARGIPARPRARPVGIPEIQIQISGVGRAYLGQLVKANATMPVAKRRRQSSRHYPARLVQRVDDDKIIPRAMHLDEGQAVGVRFHARDIKARGPCDQ